MFCIQDPSYENSKYLHETLISECVGCTTGAGAYAFATKDGINLLLLDDNFKDFLETGTFTLVVGTDDITNEHSIVSLIELQKKYGSHLVVKAYVHNGKGSTFHPKFSWFQKTDGGALVLGSGNLTQKGLRHNREAYNVVQYDEFGIIEVIDEWNRWFVHSAPFLFDITDPIVLAKAKQNSEKIKAVSTAKATVQKEYAIKPGEIKLSDIYKTQPKDKKTGTKATTKKTAVAPNDQPATISPVVTDEEIDIDASYWTINKGSSILIAEIPKSGNRWKQANFDKGTFEHYFGATCGENGEYRILLKNVNDDGTMDETEIRPSVSVSSQNYRFELDAASDLDYPDGNERPIAIFAKVSRRDFIYMLLMPEHPEYGEVMKFIGETAAPSMKMRRLQYIAGDVETRIPSLALWTRLEKEENE